MDESEHKSLQGDRPLLQIGYGKKVLEPALLALIFSVKLDIAG